MQNFLRHVFFSCSKFAYIYFAWVPTKYFSIIVYVYTAPPATEMSPHNHKTPPPRYCSEVRKFILLRNFVFPLFHRPFQNMHPATVVATRRGGSTFDQEAYRKYYTTEYFMSLYLATNCTEQNPWKADSYSDIQKIHRILRNSNFHYLIIKANEMH
jgi:hypothetical protein